MGKAELKPYMKVCLKNGPAVCAIYEPHPFRTSALPGDLSMGISDDEWCWTYYDWCGNPIGISDDMPEGDVVPTFTAENVGSKELADYLNVEYPEFIEAWNRRVNDENRATDTL